MFLLFYVLGLISILSSNIKGLNKFIFYKKNLQNYK